MGLPKRAAAATATLEADGRRSVGRWSYYGSVQAVESEIGGSSESWRRYMSMAGLVLAVPEAWSAGEAEERALEETLAGAVRDAVGPTVATLLMSIDGRLYDGAGGRAIR